jgi:glycosyltransferase involved in cell wall biosynthesis
LRAFIVCPGLSHVNRGYETFARECFEALRGTPGLSLTLAKGSGPVTRDNRSVPTLRRDASLTRLLAARLRRDPFVLEQWSFAAGLVPLLVRRRPQVILLSEWSVAFALDRWRRVSRQTFRMVLSNGAPGWPPFPPVEHIQQITPNGLTVALDGGEPAERHTVLPLGLHVKATASWPSREQRAATRRRLGLPADRQLLLSVAALNNHHKRLHYLIDEVAVVPEPRPHLVMLGQREDETPGVLARAAERLGADGFTAATVPKEAVDDYYVAADAFVLTSTTEGMGRVFLEALAAGLPVLAHRYPTTDYVLGPHGLTADLRQPGELARLVAALGPDELDDARRSERHRWVYERFSWDVLAPQYVELLARVAAG